MGNEYQEKLRSLHAPRRVGSSRQIVERAERATLITTEHWDGRKDATVRPDTQRLEAIAHRTGRKRGQVAEIKEREAHT